MALYPEHIPGMQKSRATGRSGD